MKEPYKTNCKILENHLKKIIDDVKNAHVLLLGKVNTVKTVTLSKSIYRFNALTLELQWHSHFLFHNTRVLYFPTPVPFSSTFSVTQLLCSPEKNLEEQSKGF